MSGAGRGIWLLIPLMVLVGDWRESCFSGDQVGLLMNCYLVEVMVVEWGSGVGWLWCRGVMESDGTGIGYW